MKKIILLILMSFMSLLGYSQLSENFEGAPATPDGAGVWTLPGSGNWLVRDNRTNGLPNWEVNPAAFPAHQGDKAAFINRENTGPGVLAEEWLITPQINVPANRQLRFFTRQTLSGDLGTKYQVRVSSDPDQSNLAAFTILQEYTETELSVLTDDQLDYEEKIINFAFTGNRYFAFVKVFTQPAAATSGDRWLIDDVQILERCADPTTLLVENTTVTSTTATWVSTAPNFTLEWGLSGFVPGTGTIIQNIANNSNPPAVPNSYPIIGLTPDTQYQYYITAVCSLTTSEQTGPFNFTTAPLGSTCDGPIVVTPLPYFDVGDTFQQGNNIDFNSPGATGCGTTGNFLDGDDVVYSYTVPATTTGLISIEMNPLGASNTGVFVYSNCADIGSNCIAGVGNSNGNIR
ncbi:MAG TPA: choice-of-anchor J domain-containing protein, partial [Flavobacterium sp.]|nr:choice-of-anchor J domain-containing protein [Flavobacterium sp.]